MKPLIALVAALSLAACSGGPYQLTQGEQNSAQLGARQFSQNFGAEFVGCSASDSDKDGYVTCTGKDKASGAPDSFLCSYKDNAVGCKPK